MNIKEYFGQLNKKSQSIFEQTMLDHERLGRVHYFASSLFDFSRYIKDADEQNMIRVACSQFEMSSLSLAFGLYRQALASLRLAFEVGLGTVYFSSNKIEHKEWLQGRGDLKWAILSDENNGLFSCRFADAFFPELRVEIHQYGCQAKSVYRQLSEYVHGNNETWSQSGIVLEQNPALTERYFTAFTIIAEILLFSLCCRYLKSFSAGEIDDLQAVIDDLSHISAIREITGGPKDIK